MSALLCLLLSLAGDVPPRRVEASEMHSRVYPASWLLPDALWLPKDGASERALPRSVPALLAARFEAPAPWMASVGDMIAEHRRRGGDRKALDAVLTELRSAVPEVHARVAPLLGELLDFRAPLTKGWDPDQDRADDGVYFGPLLERNALASEPWSEHGGSRSLHQAATFVRADLDALLAAVHDYASAFDDPGTSYERLEPREGGVVVGEGDDGPFAALRVRVRSDLPFPFTHYDCDLRVYHGLEDGVLVTHVYSNSHDFRWFAGKDWYLPVRSSAGEWLGTLVVRLCGFDLAGVPDNDEHRKSGTRAALGNLRRRAEERFAAQGGTPRTTAGAIPSFAVTTPGKRRE